MASAVGGEGVCLRLFSSDGEAEGMSGRFGSPVGTCADACRLRDADVPAGQSLCTEWQSFLLFLNREHAHAHPRTYITVCLA